MKRGDVYIAELKPRSGSEQKGVRPVVIVSHDGFNEVETWRSMIIVPFSTSGSQAKRGPTAIFVPKDAGGLKEDSVALCHQITTLDRSKLTKHLGSLPDEIILEINEGLKMALHLII